MQEIPASGIFSAMRMCSAVYAEVGKAVKNIGKTVGLINRAIHMDGTEEQTMARNIRNYERYNNDAAVGALYVQMLRDGGDAAVVLEGSEVDNSQSGEYNENIRQGEKPNNSFAPEEAKRDALVQGEKELSFHANDSIISQKKTNFIKAFQAGEIGTEISMQKQSRHVRGTKEYIQYVEAMRNSGGTNLPSFIRDDLNINSLSRLIVPKLKGNVRVNSDGSFEEFVMCDEMIGYYYSPSKGMYIGTRCVKVKYSLGRNKNIHIIPVKEKVVTTLEQ